MTDPNETPVPRLNELGDEAERRFTLSAKLS
jgi:hypothetical protein